MLHIQLITIQPSHTAYKTRNPRNKGAQSFQIADTIFPWKFVELLFTTFLKQSSNSYCQLLYLNYFIFSLRKPLMEFLSF